MARRKGLSNALSLYNKKVPVSPYETAKHLIHPLNGENGRRSPTASMGWRWCQRKGPFPFLLHLIYTFLQVLSCVAPFPKKSVFIGLSPQYTHTHRSDIAKTLVYTLLLYKPLQYHCCLYNCDFSLFSVPQYLRNGAPYYHDSRAGIPAQEED